MNTVHGTITDITDHGTIVTVTVDVGPWDVPALVHFDHRPFWNMVQDRGGPQNVIGQAVTVMDDPGGTTLCFDVDPYVIEGEAVTNEPESEPTIAVPRALIEGLLSSGSSDIYYESKDEEFSSLVDAAQTHQRQLDELARVTGLGAVPAEEPQWEVFDYPLRDSRVAIEAYVNSAGLDIESDGIETVVSDLLADLRHFAADQTLSWDTLIERTIGHYREEVIDRARGKGFPFSRIRCPQCGSDTANTQYVRHIFQSAPAYVGLGNPVWQDGDVEGRVELECTDCGALWQDN